jgi:hypothetical protein
VAADTLTREPLEFRAGDSISWEKSLGDYSAADYTLTYRARGVAQFDITCTTASDGITFAASLTAAQTTALQAGDYWIVGTVVATSGGDTKTIYAANIRVLPNFQDASAVQAGYDGRTHARKMLDSLESAQLNEGGSRIVEYTIMGERSVKRFTADEFIKEHTYWRNIVTQEERAAALARGDDGAGKIYIRRRETR